MEEGRKSFRAISREIKMSTSTVKSRYERLVNMGLFKSVKPEIDLSKVDKVMKGEFFGGEETIKLLEEQKRILPCESRDHGGKDAMRILRRGDPMNSKPEVLEIAELSAIFLLCRLQEQP